MSNLKGLHILKFGKRIKYINFGRSSDCDIKIMDETIAPKHTMLMLANNNFYISNQSSSNITQVLIKDKILSFDQNSYMQVQIENVRLDIWPLR